MNRRETLMRTLNLNVEQFRLFRSENDSKLFEFGSDLKCWRRWRI